MKTTIDIPEHLAPALHRLSEERGIPVEEIIEQSVESMLGRATPGPIRDDPAFGSWKSVDGRAYIEELRNEWTER